MRICKQGIILVKPGSCPPCARQRKRTDKKRAGITYNEMTVEQRRRIDGVLQKIQEAQQMPMLKNAETR